MTSDAPVVPIVLGDRDAVRIALEDDALVPVAIGPPTVGPRTAGSTMALRDAMARFSPPATHPGRRTAVVHAIERIDPAAARAAAAHRTRMRLDGGALDAVGVLACVVPTEALALCLDVGRAGGGEGGVGGEREVGDQGEAALGAVVADVEAVVAVIGRGEPPTRASDAAVDRLMTRFADHPSGAVPVLSMLYQNLDATAAVVATTLLAAAVNRPATPAVPRTRRVAARATAAGRVAIPTGAPIILEIGAAGLPFGAGPHQCPGQTLAEQIVAGLTSAIHDAGYRVDHGRVRTDADGRPTTLPITPCADASVGDRG